MTTVRVGQYLTGGGRIIMIISKTTKKADGSETTIAGEIKDLVALIGAPGQVAALAITNDTKHEWKYCAHYVVGSTADGEGVDAGNLKPGDTEVAVSYLGLMAPSPLPATIAVSYYFIAADGSYRLVIAAAMATQGVHAEIMYKSKDDMEKSILPGGSNWLTNIVLRTTYSASINAGSTHATSAGATESFELTATCSFQGFSESTAEATVAVTQTKG
jgi:hypothetical protein